MYRDPMVPALHALFWIFTPVCQLSMGFVSAHSLIGLSRFEHIEHRKGSHQAELKGIGGYPISALSIATTRGELIAVI